MNAIEVYSKLKKIAERQLNKNPKRKISACWYYDDEQAMARKNLGISNDRDLLVEVQKLACLDETNYYYNKNYEIYHVNPAWVVATTVSSELAWMLPEFVEETKDNRS